MEKSLSRFQEKVYKLVEDMKEIYDEKTNDKIISEKIQRGTKSPVSASFEEKFTIFLSEILDDRYTYIIDFTLSKYDTSLNNSLGSFKPDILVLEKLDEIKSKVCAVFECKLDISYASDVWVKSMSERNDYFNKFNVKFRLYKHEFNLKEKRFKLLRGEDDKPLRSDNFISLEAQEGLKTMGVVLCKENDHNRWETLTNTTNYENVNVLYISDKHLNNPSTKIAEVLEDNKNYWEENFKSFLVNEMGLSLKI